MDNTKDMFAVVTTGIGDYDKLSYQKVDIPILNDDDVLVKVLASSINNTDINTRVGWYSEDGGWQGSTQFPLIQGTDGCGIVVKAGKNVKNIEDIIHKRVLIRPCQKPKGFDSYESEWMASDFNGAFAEFVKVKATEVFVINSEWSDEELASIPCAYGTAENMLHRADIKSSERILVVGASGGVGSATVQLAKRGGAIIDAITSKEKIKQLINIGCTNAYDRDDNILQILGENFYNAIFDNVGGPNFPTMLKLLKVGGRYVTSGAIAGAEVKLDLRDLYLKDIKLIGCTCWEEQVFPNLISYIEKNEIKPLIAKVFPLSEIVEAQKEFLTKKHLGKIVLTLNN